MNYELYTYSQNFISLLYMSDTHQNETGKFNTKLPLVKLGVSFPDEGSCMLPKRWKNNCQFLASANESLVMDIPSHSGLFRLSSLFNLLPFYCYVTCTTSPFDCQHFRLLPIDLHTPFIHHFIKHPSTP